MATIQKLQDIEITESVAQNIQDLAFQLAKRSKRRSVDEINEIIKQPEVTTFVAIDDGKVVGMISCVIATLLHKKEMFIEELVVAESQRGKGIGRSLFQAVMDYGNAAQIDEITLTSNASNPARANAIKLYESFGIHKADTNTFRLIYPASND